LRRSRLYFIFLKRHSVITLWILSIFVIEVVSLVCCGDITTNMLPVLPFISALFLYISDITAALRFMMKIQRPFSSICLFCKQTKIAPFIQSRKRNMESPLLKISANISISLKLKKISYPTSVKLFPLSILLKIMYRTALLSSRSWNRTNAINNKVRKNHLTEKTSSRRILT